MLKTPDMGVSKNRGKTPKMDGENNGKPYEQMGWFGGKPTIFGNIHGDMEPLTLHAGPPMDFLSSSVAPFGTRML